MLTYYQYLFYLLMNQFIKGYYVFLMFRKYLILLFFKWNYFNYFC